MPSTIEYVVIALLVINLIISIVFLVKVESIPVSNEGYDAAVLETNVIQGPRMVCNMMTQLDGTHTTTCYPAGTESSATSTSAGVGRKFF